MLPRQVILPVVFAKEAADSRKLNGYDWTPIFGANNPTNSIPATKLADASLPGSKIQPGTITSNQIAPQTLNASLIANGTIDGSKLANNAIQDRHIGILSRLTASDGDPTNAVVLDGVGNVGIGTAVPAAKLDVDGRILRKSQPFSFVGSTNDNGVIAVPWGTVGDWNIFVAPRRMGHFEAGSENDNALLMIECYATQRDSTSWTVTARYRWKYSNVMPSGEGTLNGGEANYLLLPK